MTITKEQIIEMATNWANYNGWTAETCGWCETKANVLAGRAGWHCVCNHYNAQSFSDFSIPFSEPSMGPRRKLISEAHHEAAKGE